VAAQMEHSWIMPELFPPKLDARAEIMGERGVLEIDLRNQGLSLFTSDRAEVVDTSYFVDGGAEERGAEAGGAEVGVAKVFPGMPSGSLVDQIRAFLACIARGTEVPVSAGDALEAVKVAQAMHDSVREGRVVELDEYEGG